jgi:hypothetical protein
MNTVLIILFVVLMAFFKSLSDTLIHHFDTSVFKRWKGNKFVDSQVSWKEKYNYGLFVRWIRGTWGDLWHLSNSAMLTSAFVAFALAIQSDVVWWHQVLIYWVVYGVVFEFFYGIWQIKKPKI